MSYENAVSADIGPDRWYVVLSKTSFIAGIIIVFSSVPMSPSSPAWGFKPVIIILGWEKPKYEIRLSLAILIVEIIISFVNKTNPSVFLTFENNQLSTVDYFQGKHSLSNIGKKLAEIIGPKINKTPNGKNNMLLKNTKAVSIIINGNFFSCNSIIAIIFPSIIIAAALSW